MHRKKRNFRRFENSGYEVVDQVGTSVVGCVDGGCLVTKGFAKKRLLQVISVTAQVQSLPARAALSGSAWGRTRGPGRAEGARQAG